jgi:hypothetical protein
MPALLAFPVLVIDPAAGGYFRIRVWRSSTRDDGLISGSILGLYVVTAALGLLLRAMDDR